MRALMRGRPIANAMACAIACACVLSRVASAHTALVHEADGSMHDLWSHWGAPLPEVLLLALPAVWYGAGVRALWRRAGAGRGVSRAAVMRFGAGMLLLWMALLSPLDAVADALFSAHMLQHMLLILAAAPLLVAGAPLLPMLWALPLPWRQALARGWARRPRIREGFRALLSPLTVFVLNVLVLWFWHAPGPYQAALARPGLHALEHASFLLSACALWWVIAPPTTRHASPASAMMLVVCTLGQSGVLGALLTLSAAPWYPAHAAGARAWGMSPLGDQQLAGLLMWVPAGFVYVGAAARLFLRWMLDDERRHSPRSAPHRGAPRRLSVARQPEGLA